MFCLILAHPWNCILTVMLKTFCLKYLGKSLKEKLVKKKQGFREIVSFCRVWWYPPIILALGKQRQKN